LLLPFLLFVTTAELWAAVHRTVLSIGGRQPVQLNGVPTVRNGATGGPEYVEYVFVYLASIRFKLLVICLLDDICGQRPSFILRSPLRFLTFLLAGEARTPLSAALLPHRTITSHQITGIFSWTMYSAFIHEAGKL